MSGDLRLVDAAQPTTGVAHSGRSGPSSTGSNLSAIVAQDGAGLKNDPVKLREQLEKLPIGGVAWWGLNERRGTRSSEIVGWIFDDACSCPRDASQKVKVARFRRLADERDLCDVSRVCGVWGLGLRV